MFYHNLDLWIEQDATGSLSLRSTCDAHGEYPGHGSLDPSTLTNSERALEDRVISRDQQVALGTVLYQVLFVGTDGNIQLHLGQCLGGSQAERSRGVRLRLRCDAPALARIPWEYIYSGPLGGFLSASTRTPVVRYIEQPRPILELECPTPARMLLVIPQGSGLDTPAEKDRLLAAMRDLEDVVTATVLEGRVTEQDIERALSRERYQLFHFIGHGGFDGDAAFLMLNKPTGDDWDQLDHQRFGSLFTNHPSLKLIVLNSCKGAEVSPLKPFVGMAPELIRQGVPAVVAMHYEILDEEAIAFAAAFYESLFRSADRGRVELAMSQARHSLERQFPDTGAVGTPVLFMHAKEGVLFDPAATTALSKIPISPRAIARTTAVKRTHEENIRVLERDASSSDAGLSASQERGALARAARRLQLGVVAVAAGTLVALATSYLALVVGFLSLPPWARIETYAVWVADLVGHHDLDPRIKLVSSGRKPEDWVDGKPFGAAWRPAHAVVIDKLRQAGARVIVLAFSMPDPSDNDAPLVESLRRARAAGVHVLTDARIYTDGVPRVAPDIAGLVAAGFACYGERRVHSARSMPVLVEGSRAGEQVRVSLPLQAVAAFRGESVRGLDRSATALDLRSNDGRARVVDVLDVRSASSADRFCGAITDGDRVASEIIDYSSGRDLRAPDRRFEYRQLLNGTRQLPDLSHSIVIVGPEQDDVAFPVWRATGTEHRYAPELLADMINTLLNGTVIRPAAASIQTLFVIVMAVIGAWIGVSTPRRRWQPIATIAVVIGAYIVVSGVLYNTRHLMLNTAFHLLALGVSLGLVRFVRTTWFSSWHPQAVPMRTRIQTAVARCIVLAIGLGLSTGCASFAQLGAVTIDGRVVSGDELRSVRIVREGAVVSVAGGMPLKKADEISTTGGTRAVITFRAGYEVILNEGTTITIENPSIFVRIGMAFVRKLADFVGRPDSLPVSAGSTSFLPVGTQFIVSVPDRDRVVVSVLEGAVRARSKTRDWPPVEYRAMEQGTIVEGRPPERMQRLSPAEVSAIFAWVREVDKATAVRSPLPAPRITVPSVVGHELAAATKEIEGANLRVGRVVYQPDSSVARGAVIATDPRARSDADRGQRVTIYVRGCVVPVLRQGTDATDARRRVTAAGLIPAPAGRGDIVKSQRTAANSVLACGSTVSYDLDVKIR